MIARAYRHLPLGKRGWGSEGEGGRVREKVGRDPCVLSCSRVGTAVAHVSQSTTTFLTLQPRTSAMNTNIVGLMDRTTTFATQI